MNLLLWASTSAVLIPMCASPKRYWGQELTQFISNKAVADGAVSFYIDHFVSARVSKFAYGLEMYCEFDPLNNEHKRRENKTFKTPEGSLGIRGIFSVILPQVRDAPAINCIDLNLTLMFQNTKVLETEKFSKFYCKTASKKTSLESVNLTIFSYRGKSTDSEQWMDKEECKIPIFQYLIDLILHTQRSTLPYVS